MKSDTSVYIHFFNFKKWILSSAEWVPDSWKWAFRDFHIFLVGALSVCCTWFAHDCAQATGARVFDTVLGAVRKLWQIFSFALKYDYYYYQELLPSVWYHRWSPPRPIGWASASRTEDNGFESHLRQDFSRSSHTSELKIGTPVATLPGAWHYKVSAGTGRPGVSILWLVEVESLICNLYLSVAAHKIVSADPSLRYTRMLLER